MDKPEKLNLEFEDDNDTKIQEMGKKEKDYDGDIHLDFSAHTQNPETPIAPQREEADKKYKEMGKMEKQRHETGQLSEILHLPSENEQKRRRPSSHHDSKRNSYKLGDEIENATTNNPLLTAEIEANLQINIQKNISAMEVKHAQEAKALEIKIDRLLSRILKEAPFTKDKLMKIKKLLVENSRMAQTPSSPKIFSRPDGLKKLMRSS